MFGDSVPNRSNEGSKSCLVWFPWWLQHGAMDPLEGTLLGDLSTDLTSEFAHFNPGIRLRNLEQLAFFSMFHRRSLTVELLAAVPGFTTFHFSLQLCGTPWKPPFFNVAQTTDRCQLHLTFTTWQGDRTCLQVWCSFFLWLSWWGQTVVHLIREDLAAVTCPYGLTDHVPVMGVTHELLRSELNPCFLVLFLIN